ncbi:anionic trypsin-2-like isoform X2 [Anneissia japonica]|uniref:anionic trypsin-2-like isoform X2 n=1 Tax=Anneissia japonica TaxID=1529436 RepID=UPI0014254D80|nr:anionic trypsin-2-like isoform X2 [Anneissia japonica]
MYLLNLILALSIVGTLQEDIDSSTNSVSLNSVISEGTLEQDKDVSTGSVSLEDAYVSTDSCSISPEEVCGVVTSKVHHASYSDKRAIEGSAPWAVRLYHITPRRFICGGSILNYEWVVTAAHCLGPIHGPEDVSITIGDYDVRYKDPDEEILNVSRIITHPEFEKKTFNNDIALIRLSSKIRRFTNYVRPVCLPSVCLGTGLKTPHALMRFHGWGLIRNTGPTPVYMKELTLPFLEFTACEKSAEPFPAAQITESMICLDHDDDGLGSCFGDGGTGLVRKYLGRWYLVGINSWGIGCGVPGNYDFFTDVVKFRKWIIESINDG